MFSSGKDDKNVSRSSELSDCNRQIASRILKPDEESNLTQGTNQSLFTKFNVKSNRSILTSSTTTSNVRETQVTSTNSTCVAKNCTALDDKNTDVSNETLLASKKNSHVRVRSSSDSLESEIRNCVTSLEGASQRFLSLQSSIKLIGTGQTSRQIEGKQTTNGTPGHRNLEVDRRIKCAISSRVGKIDSWLVNSGVKAATNFLGSIFILSSLLLLALGRGALIEIADSASLPPTAIQPIWLRDGLITIGHESIEDDSADEADDLVDPQHKPLDRSLYQLQSTRKPYVPHEQQQRNVGGARTGFMRITNQDLEQIPALPVGRKQASPPSLAVDKNPWFQIGSLQLEKKDHNADGLSDELFWIERRRLERDRALEPPPWMREQPMRRNIAPQTREQDSAAADPEEEIAVEIPRTNGSTEDEDLLSAARPSRGRQSRQSADQIYESLLKLLAEGTYGTSSFLDELRDEIEQRSEANQRSQKIQHLNDNANGDNEPPMQLQKSQKQQHFQIIGQNGQVQIDTQENLGLDQEPDVTLVVAGDEVSSNDGGETTIEADQGGKQTSAAYTLPGAISNADDGASQASASETAYGNAFSTGLLGLAYPKQAESQPVGEFITRPEEVHRLISSVDLGMSPIAAVELQQQQQQQPLVSSSFHVIEDIDQMDNSQDNSEINEHPSFNYEAGDMSSEQQQQQQPDSNNWDTLTEVNNRPMKSLQMKRSGSKLLLQKVLGGDLQQLHQDSNKDPSSGRAREVLPAGRLLSSLRKPSNSLSSEQKLAEALLDSGELSEEQLARTKNKLLRYMENMIGLTPGTILGFYPLSNNKLLIKLDTTKQNPRYVLTMFKKYGSLDFARGYIVVTWPPNSRDNPIGLLSATLHEMAKHDEIDNLAAAESTSTASADVDAGDGDDGGDSNPEADEVPLAPIGKEVKWIRFGDQYWLANPNADKIEPSLGRMSIVASAEREQPSSLFGGQSLSLAALVKYLSALYAVDQLSASNFGASVQVDPSIIVPTVGGKMAQKVNSTNSELDYQRYLLYLTISISALLCMYITFKLIMKGKPRRALRRRFRHNDTLRSLWSESSDGDDIIDNDAGQISAASGVLNHQQQSEGGKGSDLQAGNPLAAANRRQLSASHYFWIDSLSIQICCCCCSVVRDPHHEPLAKHDEIDNLAAAESTSTASADVDAGDGDDGGDSNPEADEVPLAPIGKEVKWIRFGDQYWLANPNADKIEPSLGRMSIVASAEREQPSSLFGGQSLSLAALVKYLSALYAVDQLSASNFGASVQVDPSIIVPTVGGKMAQKVNSTNSELDYQRYLLYLTISISALLCMYITFKLIMKGKPRRALRRRFRHNDTLRSLWSESSDGDDIIDNDAGQISAASGVLNHQQQSEGGKGSDLQAGNPLAAANRRQLSADSGLVSNMDSGPDKKQQAGSIDVLAQRLINLLRYHHHYQRHKDSLGDLNSHGKTGKSCGKRSERNIDKDKKELDEVLANEDYFDEIDEGDGNQHQADKRKHYRSSNSYIKSLIDVLSKARAQFPSGYQSYASYGKQNRGSTKNQERTPLTACDTLDQESDELAAAEELVRQQIDEDLTGAEVAMSQMDISAAHLILAYMEKHLEDREQLRREWLELNGNAASSAVSGQANKIVQLTLQKLAKVALCEENRAKNRSCLVVPFDRNRVRLGNTAPGAEPPASVKGITGGRKQQSDYINASYIYDDDLRKPTHIIAQGPLEQTCGQFWQMIWEQGISVIVMLTRLNENSTQMCHCYWPKDKSFAADAPIAGNPPPARSPLNPLENFAPATELTPAQRAAFWRDDSIQTVAGGGASSPTAANGCRRVSVTSVFSTLEARQNGNGQPIVANGDLSNNTICFDVEYSSPTNSPSPDADPRADDQTSGKSCTATTRFEVHLVSEHVSSNDYLVRNMYMINRSTGETRTITQFHYLAWPESGVPDNVKSFLAFRRKVHKSYRNLKSPILVHCSDGGGRSGTYTLIDIILERIKNGAKEIDPRATLEHLRDQRVGLCATQSQFEFVSVALAEEIQIILNALPK